MSHQPHSVTSVRERERKRQREREREREEGGRGWGLCIEQKSHRMRGVNVPLGLAASEKVWYDLGSLASSWNCQKLLKAVLKNSWALYPVANNHFTSRRFTNVKYINPCRFPQHTHILRKRHHMPKWSVLFCVCPGFDEFTLAIRPLLSLCRASFTC